MWFGAIFGIGSLALAALAVFAQRRWQAHRRARLDSLELRPNCLLTRFPLVFLAGPQSLFRLFEHWHELPAYLREHGYEVYVLQPFQRTADEIIQALESVGSPCHLIADTSFARELSALADHEKAPLASLTRVQCGVDPEIPRNAYRPHRVPIEVFTPPSTTKSFVASALLKAHNWSRRLTVNGHETGDFAANGWVFEEQFLDYAIQLAERDARG